MQLTMPGFEAPPVVKPLYAEGVITKKQAQASGDAFTQRELVFEVLKKHGTLTVHEIAAFCSLDAHEIGKRVPELAAVGRIVKAKHADGTEVRRKSPSGRTASVWDVA